MLCKLVGFVSYMKVVEKLAMITVKIKFIPLRKAKILQIRFYWVCDDYPLFLGNYRPVLYLFMKYSFIVVILMLNKAIFIGNTVQNYYLQEIGKCLMHR